MQGLELALSLQSRTIDFVGSSRKIAHLKSKLIDQGYQDDQLKTIKSPAGIDIHAVTPQEIALSILADVVRRRRHDFAGRGSDTARQTNRVRCT